MSKKVTISVEMEVNSWTLTEGTNGKISLSIRVKPKDDDNYRHLSYREFSFDNIDKAVAYVKEYLGVK